MEQQENLGLKVDRKISSVEDYKFEPIKGYPMLSWKGKRPFNSTQYYPAQLKEILGKDKDGWINKIFWGDNLQVMGHLLKEFRGQVDLVYIDPPFDSRADYKKKISLKGKHINGDSTSFEEKQYTDLWSNDEYLQFIYERTILLRELLADTGSIYVHCDYRRSHYIKLIMDEVFGPENFLNEIVWVRTNSHNMKAKGFVRSNDYILLYTKTREFTFNEQYLPYGESQLKEYRPDENGRMYTTRDLTFSSINPNRQFEWRGTKPPANRSWGASLEQLEQWFKEGKIILNKEGKPRLRGLKVFLDEAKGAPLTTNWDDVGRVGNTSSERLDYPTQKSEELLERIISTSSNKGDLVFDCFMGSGTTQAVALKTGRRFIGADINLGAIQTTTKRILNVFKDFSSSNELKFSDNKKDELYLGLQVYNVNHYDIFRNPVQAQELLIKALEIQPFPPNNLYDGEKDGRMVKIMPVNRIATRVDLNELITGFDYRAFEKRNETAPGKPVELLLLVCMGHEPDLAAFLKEQVKASGYLVDVEVVDILRSKENLEFKRDSEAEVVVEGDKLVVRQFYPMNLLQKMSLLKENVEDWREMVESIMIDFNYDGAVLEPQVIDVPEGKELVKGFYQIPPEAGTIRIKITDLLSESLETTVNG